MKKLLTLVLLAGLLGSVNKAYAAGFAPDDAWNIGAGMGVLMMADSANKVVYTTRAEVPAFGALKFLAKIPGFAFELGLGMDQGLFFQFAPTMRYALADPFVLKAGFGAGIHFKYSYYVPVVAGFDLFVRDNIALTGNFTMPLAGADEIKNAMRLNIGIALAGRYEN